MSESPHSTVPTPRNQYVFIDGENCLIKDLESVRKSKNVKIILFVGPQQKSLPLTFCLFMQENPDRLQIVETMIQGNNALDFVLIFELSATVAKDPSASFHIVSKDTGFDAVIKHMKTRKLKVSRSATLPTETVAANPPTAAEKNYQRLLAILRGSVKNRPGNLKSLRNFINSHFQGAMEPALVDKTVELFVRKKVLSVTATDQVIYPAA